VKLTKSQRETLKCMFGGLCAYCGKPLGDRWHADHFEPIRRNNWGRNPNAVPEHPERDTEANLMPACAPCNIDKHTFSLEEWRGQLERRCEVLRNSYAQYRSMVRFGLVYETGFKVVFHFERVKS
jgi:5-methylcytosine-specific restriction endonuclease McrA